MKQEKEEKETDTGIDKYVQKLITQEKQKIKQKTSKQINIQIYNIYCDEIGETDGYRNRQYLYV